MFRISVKEARSKLSLLLNRVQVGDEIVILRRGKVVARLVPPKPQNKVLPSLKDFRTSIRVRGKPLSSVVIRAREEERY